MSNAQFTRRRPTTFNSTSMDEQKGVKGIAARAKEIRQSWSPEERAARAIEAQLAQLFLAANINLDQHHECSIRSSTKMAG